MSFFLRDIVLTRSFGVEDLFFVLFLPGLGIFLAFLFVDVNEERVANVFKVGRFFHKEFGVIRWKDILDIEVYRTSRKEFVNFKITTANGRRRSFSIPEGSFGAEKFEELVRQKNKVKA